MYDLTNLKKIDEQKLGTKLIKDLGMIFKSSEQQNGEARARYAMIECIKCKQPFKSKIFTSNITKTSITCKLCKLKPLFQNEFKMPIIKDLGMINSKASKNKYRAATFKCNSCKNNFDNKITQAKNNKDGLCYPCNYTKNNPNASEYGTRLYNIWRSMLARGSGSIKAFDRSYNSKHITVCNIWTTNFKAFKQWALENNYNDLLTIDRINNNDIYKPNNCRWTNGYVQSQNTRKLQSRNTSGYRGVSYIKKTKKYRAQIHSFGKRIALGVYQDKEDAALAYDEYVLYNCTNHTTNFIYD